MGVTKKQLADTLGVAKQTVVNYIDRLNLAPEHVSRVGKADFLDDYAASAIADAIGKSIPQKVVPAESQSVDSDAVVAALTDRIRDLKEQNDRLNKEIVDLRSAYERDLENLRAQLSEANGHLVESSGWLLSLSVNRS